MQRPKKIDAETMSIEASTFWPRTLNPALPKTAQVYDRVRRAIVMLEMPPGASVSEKMICEQLGISRTPLREAILQLHAEKLVEVRPNAGTFVSQIDLQHVMDGQVVREALEMKVVRLAARKVTREFARALDFNLHQQRVLAADKDYEGFYDLDEAMHQMICEFGSSPQIWRIVTGAKAHLDRVRRLAFPEDHHLDIVLAEHTAIIDGLKAGDAKAAATAMSGHLNRVFKTIRHLLSQRSEFFAPNSRAILDQFERIYD
jgi:GntR family transcriptional regulator, rspAB operon transcriptional repressor